MAESSDRKELEKRLEQARRVADLALDPLTKERLHALVHELEEQLRLSEPGRGAGPPGAPTSSLALMQTADDPYSSRARGLQRRH